MSFLDLSCLNPHKKRNQIECEFCGCQINNDVVHVFRPKPGVAETRSERGWEGWVEWILDDGTSTCKAFGGEEVSYFTKNYRYKNRIFRRKQWLLYLRDL